jgi:hypothetical protein
MAQSYPAGNRRAHLIFDKGQKTASSTNFVGKSGYPSAKT